jgi:hypothetical protein
MKDALAGPFSLSRCKMGHAWSCEFGDECPLCQVMTLRRHITGRPVRRPSVLRAPVGNAAMPSSSSPLFALGSCLAALRADAVRSFRQLCHKRRGCGRGDQQGFQRGTLAVSALQLKDGGS